MEGATLARKTDLAFLKMDTGSTVGALREAVELARSGGFRSLCVPPVLAGTVKKHNPTLRVSAVVSFPLGADSLAAKVFCAQELIEQQADELDIVLDLFALVNGNLKKTELEARQLIEICKPAGVLLKAIVEASLLSEDQLRSVCELLCGLGVDCIKTGTGFQRPVTIDQVRLIRQVAGTRCLIKASGGIRSAYDAQALLQAGADILGLSDGAVLLSPSGEPVGA
jgi:deoxyribose-phosphate aldolase